MFRTDAHFIVRNNSLSAGGVPVVRFNEISNGTVENNLVSGGIIGIFCGRCSDVTLKDNLIGAGIFDTQSNNTVITGNTISHRGQQGINLDLTFNATVDDNSIANSNVGVELHYSYDVTITNNIISAGHVGIKVYRHSFNTTIINNTISVPSLSDVDISLEYTKNTIMIDNRMSRGGILILGDSLENWNTHVIATSNTVIGKTVHYLKNSTGGIIDSESGQVILANCSGVAVDNLDVSGVHAGFQIGFTNNSAIPRNHVHNNYWGITILSSFSPPIGTRFLRILLGTTCTASILKTQPIMR